MNLNSYEVHVPTERYGFILGKLTGSAEDAALMYKEIKRVWDGGAGVGMKEFARIVHEYCTTGAIVNGGNYDFSANEKLLMAELRKLIRNKNK